MLFAESGYHNGALYIYKDTTTDIKIQFTTPNGYILTEDFLFEGGMKKYNRYESWEGVLTKTEPDVRFNWQIDGKTDVIHAYISQTDSLKLNPGQYTFSLQVTNKKTNKKQNLIPPGMAYVLNDAGGYDAV